MSAINLSVRETTLYTVEGLPAGLPDYETFDHDKASRMMALANAGVPAAECADCKAVIPVELVMSLDPDNRCPAALSLHMRGHRVSSEIYRVVQEGKA